MKFCLMIGKEVGIIALKKVIEHKHVIISSVCYDELTKYYSIKNSVKYYDSIENKYFLNDVYSCDVLLCVHGREIVKKEILNMPKYGCFNVHPGFYKYKGADPVGRALKANDCFIDVTMHKMSEKIDDGKILFSRPNVNIKNCKTYHDAYKKLYPVYEYVIDKGLKKNTERYRNKKTR